MEFTVETTDYNVADFYDAFVKDLPKIVMVNQGFMGEISADTFDRGQILRLHTVSQQSRVIAKTQLHGHDKFFSIPLSYKTNFCVVKHGKAGKEMPLSQLIREYTLPCKVQFPKHKSVDVGNHTVHTDKLPTLKLTRVFNEVYLLGNYIIDGVLAHGEVHVPLYLSQLRLALVTGIVGQTPQKWKSYQEELNRSTINFEFNEEFGNPDIAEYMPGRVEKIAVDTDLEYAKMEPAIYTDLSKIFRHGGTTRGDLPKVDFTDNVYDQLNPYESYRQVTTTTFSDASVSTQSKNTEKPQMKSPLTNPKINKPKPPPPQRSGQSIKSPSVPAKETNQMPMVNNNPQQKLLKDQTPISQELHTATALEKPETAVKPITADRGKPELEQQSNPASSTTVHAPKHSLSPSDIEELSVTEVGTYLQTLKLDQYTKRFRDNLIDGKILKELDKDIMRDEFQMSGLEAIRLMKFIQEGHIPS